VPGDRLIRSPGKHRPAGEFGPVGADDRRRPTAPFDDAIDLGDDTDAREPILAEPNPTMVEFSANTSPTTMSREGSVWSARN